MKKQYDLQNAFCGVSNIHFVKVIRGKGFAFAAPNGKDTHGFILVRGGSIRYCFSDATVPCGQEVTLCRGDILFIPAKTSYKATYLIDQTEIVHARFDLISGELPQNLKAPYAFRAHQSEHQFNRLFELASPLVTEESRSLWGTFRIYELIWLAVSSAQKVPVKYQKLFPAVDRLQTHYAEQKKISFYAELCRMSESGFRRLFTEYTGLSPIDYRNNIRLEEAKKLIETGEYLVEEAAIEVGFHNVSFFCRAYKKRFGGTPLGNA